MRAGSAALLLALAPLAAGLAACTDTQAGASATPSATLQGRFVEPAELGEALSRAALAAGSATGRVALEGPDGTVHGTAAYRFEPDGTDLSAQVRLTGRLDADVELVLLDEVLYVEVPPAYRIFVPTPWVRTPADPSGGILRSLPLPTALPGDDLVRAGPDATMAFLGERTTASGPAEVYRVDQDGSTRTYWVGTDDRAVRVQARAADGTTSAQTYGGWGAAVAIDPPPADEVSQLGG